MGGACTAEGGINRLQASRFKRFSAILSVSCSRACVLRSLCLNAAACVGRVCVTRSAPAQAEAAAVAADAGDAGDLLGNYMPKRVSFSQQSSPLAAASAAAAAAAAAGEQECAASASSE